MRTLPSQRHALPKLPFFHRRIVVPFLQGLSLCLAILAPDARGSGFGYQRVLIIGIDGCRGDALQLAANSGTAPNIAKLIREGTVTWNSYAGGPPFPDVANQPTFSGPGWSSILTGVWTNRHRVRDNNLFPNDFANYPVFFRRIKEKVPQAYLASAMAYSIIDQRCIGDSIQGGVNFMNYRVASSSDENIAQGAATQVLTSNLDVFFVLFKSVDSAGHQSGFSKDNPAYMSAIAATDERIGRILAEVRRRRTWSPSEKWCVILTTDHGGSGQGHGGQIVSHRNTWMIVHGGNARAGRVSDEAPGQVCVPATAMKHLGLEMDPAWNMDATVFGLGPWMDAAAVNGEVLLDWDVDPELPDVSGFQIRRGTEIVANLPISARTYRDPNPGTGAHVYELRYVGGSFPPISKTIVIGDPDRDLVVDMPFDGNFSDISGRENHAAALADEPAYTPGRDGRGLATVLNGSSYLRIGSPGALRQDLQFGSDVDFTISFSMKSSPVQFSVPNAVFLSNADATVAGSLGWRFLVSPVEEFSSSRRWDWGMFGDISGGGHSTHPGRYFPSDWSHIAVVNRRSSKSEAYQDGAAAGSNSIASTGNVNSGLPVGIGCDGLGGSRWESDFVIDNLKIWRRALHPREIADLAAGNAYAKWVSLSFTAPQRADEAMSGFLADLDSDGLTTMQEFAFGRSPSGPDANPVRVSKDALGVIVRFRQRNGGIGTPGIDYAADGLRYALEYSPSLSDPDWRVVTPAEIEEAEPISNNLDGTHTVALRVRLASPGPVTFFRVRTAWLVAP